MKKIPSRIKERLRSLPDYPGVYLMKDSSGGIIYIGKASSIKKRVSSYFQKTDRDPKVNLLLTHIDDFEYVITDSEIEALILESTLIKKYKPKYNVRLKDDKRYPYIVVSLSETYPRIFITRSITNKTDRYFGPYTDARAARNFVSTINSIFKLRSCKKDLPLKKNERPCLNFQMKKCGGLCREEMTRNEYLNLIDNAVIFLEGKVEPVIKDLNKLMSDYSAEQKYENAARMRDIIFDLQKITEKQKVFSPVGKDRDYIGLLRQGHETIIVLFEFRNGILLGRKISIGENTEYHNESEILKSFIIEYYDNIQPQLRIITQFPADDKGLLEDHLSKKSARHVSISIPRAKEDKSIMKMIQKNLDVIAADRLSLQMTRDKTIGLVELMDVLHLGKIPEIIECFDISNIQGKLAAASMVRFKNGKPEKGQYRRYRIKSYNEANDPGMIHEVVGRRLQYLLNEELPMPDLIVIDGGKSQLNRALEIRNALKLSVKIISIAKRFEEIHAESSEYPIRLNNDSRGLKIIQNIRDEAHRFAVAYHKKLRAKALEKSDIENIPNIGGKKKKLLLHHFKSMENIQRSTLDELKALPGIGAKTAEIIFNYFHRAI